jgi:hypothetical protein
MKMVAKPGLQRFDVSIIVEFAAKSSVRSVAAFSFLENI